METTKVVETGDERVHRRFFFVIGTRSVPDTLLGRQGCQGRQLKFDRHEAVGFVDSLFLLVGQDGQRKSWPSRGFLSLEFVTRRSESVPVADDLPTASWLGLSQFSKSKSKVIKCTLSQSVAIFKS
jgi:hypothetical protein